MTLHQTHRTYGNNMRLFHQLGSILLCLAVASSQNRDTVKLNEIESSSKNAEDNIIPDNDTDKAASMVSITVKEVKPNAQEDNLEALDTTEQKSVLQKKKDTPSTKFGQRSQKVKEEEKTEASHRGERYVPIPKVPQLRSNPGFENSGRPQPVSRNAATYERYPDSVGQEQLRQSVSPRHSPSGDKRMGYGEMRTFAEPAHPHSDAQEYDDNRRELPRPNVHHVPRSHSRQAKAPDFDDSYDERDDECSKSKSRSVSADDDSGDRHPRQNSFRHRDGQPHYQEYADDYSYRPQGGDGGKSSESGERSEEYEEIRGRDRRPYEREQRYYDRDPREERKHNKDLPPQPARQRHGQQQRGRLPQGKDDSISQHRDSVSKTLSVSKSYSEPKKSTKVVLYDKPNSNKQRAPVVYQTTPAHVEDQPPYEEHRIHHQVNTPVRQNSSPPRGAVRGNRQNSDNAPRKPLIQQQDHQDYDQSGPRQYEHNQQQSQYSDDNDRQYRGTNPHNQHSHHQNQHIPHSHPPHNQHSHHQNQPIPHSHPPHNQHSHKQHPHSAPDEQNSPPHHHDPHSQHQHSHSRPQSAQPYIIEQQVPTESENKRQDFVRVPLQHQQGQHTARLQSSLREGRTQRTPETYEHYDSRYPPYSVDSAQGKNTQAPEYSRGYNNGPTNNRHATKEAVRERKTAEPADSYYPIQDSGIRQLAPSISSHGSPRLPETQGEPRPQVSVSYSESSYKDGQMEEHRYIPLEKTSQEDEYQRQPEYYPQDAPPNYAKTPIQDQYEKPEFNTNIAPEKTHGPTPDYPYVQKGKNQDDDYPPPQEYNSNQNYQDGPPPAEGYQHPRDDYESAPPSEEEEPYHGGLSLSFLKNHPDISDKAKIIVAEPVPGKPGVLLADGERAIVAGRMRGKNSAPTNSEYSGSPKVSSRPSSSGRERNFGITQNIPGSFAALVNTDPKFLRQLPEMMHLGSREPSGGEADSGAYYSDSSNSKEADGDKNYEGEGRSYKGRARSADLNNYGSAHGIIQDHGDGVRSMMYHIRPNKRSKHGPTPEESKTSERKQVLTGVSSRKAKSEHLHYAKSETITKTVKPDDQSNKKDNKAATNTK